MQSIRISDYDQFGIGDLSQAVAVAQTEGMVSAVGAIHEDVLRDFAPLGTMLLNNTLTDLSGVYPALQRDGVEVYSVQTDQTPDYITHFLLHLQSQITRAAGNALPIWDPCTSRSGIRMVTMRDGSTFPCHSDDYEGLVAAAQVAIDGQKTMYVREEGKLVPYQVHQGDVTLFGCDTFSKQPRRKHGFSFTGNYAVALTLGQDPHYTISGRYPLLEKLST